MFGGIQFLFPTFLLVAKGEDLVVEHIIFLALAYESSCRSARFSVLNKSTRVDCGSRSASQVPMFAVLSKKWWNMMINHGIVFETSSCHFMKIRYLHSAAERQENHGQCKDACVLRPNVLGSKTKEHNEVNPIINIQSPIQVYYWINIWGDEYIWDGLLSGWLHYKTNTCHSVLTLNLLAVGLVQKWGTPRDGNFHEKMMINHGDCYLQTNLNWFPVSKKSHPWGLRIRIWPYFYGHLPSGYLT